MKKIIFYSVCVLFVSLYSCNNKKDPSKVAEDFYTYMNTGEVKKAKELATPSAKEFIDQLEKLGVFKGKGDTEPFELMEIEKPEAPVEGDTAVVNYKIGDFKSKLSLVFNDKEWKVVFNDDLKHVRIIEMNSFDFCQILDEQIDETFLNCRFRINSILWRFSRENLIFGYPYNSENKTVLSRSVQNWTLCGIKLQSGGERLGSIDIEFNNKVENKELNSKDISFSKEEYFAYFDFEGVLSKYYHGSDIEFIDGKLLNVKTCE